MHRLLRSLLLATYLVLTGASAWAGSGDAVLAARVAQLQKADQNPEAIAAEAEVDPQALGAQITALYDEARYAEAIPLTERLLAYLKSSKNFGPEHEEVSVTLNYLATLHRNVGNYTTAVALQRQDIAIQKGKGLEGEPSYAMSLSNLAGHLAKLGRYGEAGSLYDEALAIFKRKLEPDDAAIGTLLNNRANLYADQGLYAAAEVDYTSALAIRKAALGETHPEVAQTLDNFGSSYVEQGRFAEAEPLLRESLAIREDKLGRKHHSVATSLHNLAAFYVMQGDPAEAEPLFRRALEIREEAFGKSHPLLIPVLNALGESNRTLGHFTESEAHSRRALSIARSAHGENHPDVANSLNTLAVSYAQQGRYADAEPLYKEALAIWRSIHGPKHPTIAWALSNLGHAYLRLGRMAQAETHYEDALAMRRELLGPDHPDTAAVLNNLAWLRLEQGNWPGAISAWKQSTDILANRVDASRGASLTGVTRDDIERNDWQFQGLVKADYRARPVGGAASPASVAAMFIVAQRAQASEAGKALALMSARGAKRDPALADLARQRQDLVREGQARTKLSIEGYSRPADQRDAEAEARNAARLREIRAATGAIDSELAQRFSDYAALAYPQPASIEAVQQLLRNDEALVLILDTPAFASLPEETFVWLVTRSSARQVRSEIGTEALTEHVAALRCGLDASAWLGEGEARCQQLTGSQLKRTELGTVRSGKSPPFDLARAHALYNDLFKEIAVELAGKRHLLIVPSGPLTELPFSVLLSQPPDPELAGPEALRAASWLIRDHAITVLPSVASLSALRPGQPSRATRSMIGFGNPILDGIASPTTSAIELKLRRTAARYRQSCDLPLSQEETVLRMAGQTLGAETIGAERLGAVATIEDIRRWTPVPSTGRLLCDIADDAAFESDGTVYLGDQATKANLATLNAAGELAKYRVVHFATHGVLARQVKGIDEPGLILTPPGTESPDDNGYLAASEITELKLDADWVILSACNTAAGDGRSGEALSGLASAFFYAQARALLVSHWSVYEDAAARLVATATRATADGAVGRSEALRRAMLQLIDGAEDRAVHPSYWAPFIVVGEGAAG